MGERGGGRGVGRWVGHGHRALGRDRIGLGQRVVRVGDGRRERLAHARVSSGYEEARCNKPASQGATLSLRALSHSSNQERLRFIASSMSFGSWMPWGWRGYVTIFTGTFRRLSAP